MYQYRNQKDYRELVKCIIKIIDILNSNRNLEQSQNDQIKFGKIEKQTLDFLEDFMVGILYL